MGGLLNPVQLFQPSWLTKLSPEEEKAFQIWVKAGKVPWIDTPFSDYDMRGFFKALITGNPLARRAADNGHYPDIWKTPLHQSFSNESMYANGPFSNAPQWKGNELIDKAGKVVFKEK